MIDPLDDLGTAKPPLKVVAVIPVYGRLPLLKHTIQRLLRKNGVYKVICVGHEKECEEYGAVFVNYKNNPLGEKWNVGFQVAKDYNPDACLFVGSSDFVSDNWIQTLHPYLDKHDLVGLPNCYFADVKVTENGNEYRLVNWPGYVGPRKGESIGIGRMISKQALDRCNWMPFDGRLNSSLDHSMFTKIPNRYLLKTKRCFSLSISTSEWVNLHKFEDHWTGRLKSQKIESAIAFLKENFPETLRIF